MNKTQNWMVDENHTLIGPSGNVSVTWRGEVPPCPPDAVCTVGMDNGLLLIVLFGFFLGILAGWVMRYIVEQENKEEARWSGESVQDLPEGYHSYSTNCEVYGCDDKHV